MDLESLRKQFEGRLFGELVLHHRKHTSLQNTVAALQGVISELPEAAQQLVESWIDDMSTDVRSESFWKQDCANSFTNITNAAENKLRDAGISPTTDDLFNMFQIIILNFAYSAYQHPQSKAFIQKSVGVGFFGRIFG